MGEVRPAAGAWWTAPVRRSRPMQYLVAVAAVGVATGLHWALHPHLNHDVRLTVFALAVVVAAWVGGAGPGLLATTLSVAAAMPLSLQPGAVVTITSASYLLRFVLFGILGA